MGSIKKCTDSKGNVYYKIRISYTDENGERQRKNLPARFRTKSEAHKAEENF